MRVNVNAVLRSWTLLAAFGGSYAPDIIHVHVHVQFSCIYIYIYIHVHVHVHVVSNCTINMSEK